MFLKETKCVIALLNLQKIILYLVSRPILPKTKLLGLVGIEFLDRPPPFTIDFEKFPLLKANVLRVIDRINERRDYLREKREEYATCGVAQSDSPAIRESKWLRPKFIKNVPELEVEVVERTPTRVVSKVFIANQDTPMELS
jgi:hypothetical protein